MRAEIAADLIGLGITSLFGGSFVSRTIHAFTPIALPGLSRIPGLAVTGSTGAGGRPASGAAALSVGSMPVPLPDW